MARAILCAVAAAMLATVASAGTTISGSFTVDAWDVYLDEPAAAPGPLFLAYSVTFDPTQTYADTQGVLTVQAGFAQPLGFSFNPGTSRMVLATHGSPDGCAHPETSFCAIIDDFLANEPRLVVVAQNDGAWRARSITPGDGLVSPPGVPEPASWALLIAGFGLVGAIQRQSGQRRLAKRPA